MYRAGQVRRRPLDERWPNKLVDEIVGAPKEPVPGGDKRTGALRVPTATTNTDKTRPPAETFLTKERPESFGRRVYITGNCDIGWFVKDKIHGYGSKSSKAGVYEEGMLIENETEIKYFDLELDFAA